MSIPEPGARADGQPPVTPEQLFERLRGLGIATRTVTHAPVFTVEEARRVRGDSPGAHTKSLFLRDKKGAMWLVTCREDRALDLRELADRIGARHLSFGNPARLMQYLGVIPGAVSPFAVVNDSGRSVRMVLDRAVLAAGTVHLHPLDNARTTAIAAGDLLRFLAAEGHEAEVMDFDRE